MMRLAANRAFSRASRCMQIGHSVSMPTSCASSAHLRQHLARQRRVYVSNCAASAQAHIVQPGSKTALYHEDVELYDRVFSDRNFEQETEFLVETCVKHGRRPPTSSLEIGCGPARHSVLLAKQSLRTYGLEDSPAMLTFAKQRAAAANVTIDFVQADMRDFLLPEQQRVDLAFMVCGTISHLLTNDDALRCFQSASRSLTPHGCLILEMVHPEDLFGGMLEQGPVWDIPASPGHAALSVTYGSPGDEFNPLTQVLHRTVQVTEWLDESSDKQKELLTDVVPQRFFTSQEVDLIAKASGLKVVGIYGNLSLPFCATEDEGTYALVMVLQPDST